MNTKEKINLWLKMGEAIGVPKNQIQAVRGARKGLCDGLYKVTWAETVEGDCPDDAAQMALVRLYANGNELRPDLFSLSAEDKDGVVTQVDLSGPKFLMGLQAGLKRCFQDAGDTDEPARVESEQYLRVRS